MCGLESEAEKDFVPVHSSYYAETKFYCRTCWKKHSTQNGESYLIACAILLFGGFFGCFFCPQNDLAWLTCQSGLFICFVALLAVPHELGHVFAAFITRAKIFTVDIGLSKILYQGYFGGIEWKFRAIPICGFVIPGIRSSTFHRTRSFLISLGGPMMNFLLGFIAVIVLFHTSSPWLVAVIKSFIAANIFELLYSLWPRKVNIADVNTLSDGLALLTIPFMSKAQIEKNIESYYLWEDYVNNVRNLDKKN
jgi:hypothetical protein